MVETIASVSEYAKTLDATELISFLRSVASIGLPLDTFGLISLAVVAPKETEQAIQFPSSSVQL